MTAMQTGPTGRLLRRDVVKALLEDRGEMLVIGGLGTQTGPIVGTLLITLISTRLEPYPEVRLILLGLILLVIVLAMPRGLVPLIGEWRARLTSWMNEGQKPKKSAAKKSSAKKPGGSA